MRYIRWRGELRMHSTRFRYSARGFSLIELLIVLAVVITMAIMAIPMVQSTKAYYDLQGAVQSASGTIQATRLQAISDGFPYKVAFSKADNTYQIWNCTDWSPTTPTTCTFTKAGSAIPFGSPAVTLGTDTSIQFLPSGNTILLTGTNPITLSRDMGDSTIKTRTITVTRYGSVKVQ